MVTALSLSLMATLVNLAVPMFTKHLVDGFTLATLHKTTIALLIEAFVAQTFASGFSIYFINHTGRTIVSRLRERLWKKLLALPISYYDRYRTGETVSRVTNDTAIVKSLITEQVANFLNGVISMIGSDRFAFIFRLENDADDVHFASTAIISKTFFIHCLLNNLSDND
nr:ABC transporter transmembrane domain-containing protein [Saccharococcus thermophilus]